MFFKKNWLIMLTTITAVLLLAACGGSNKSKIIGIWKAAGNDQVDSYLEIGEERIINRSQSNDSPVSAEYILTETQDGNFILEVVDPESGSTEFLFEGYFKNKDKIIVINTTNGAGENAELIRVKNMAKEKEKEAKRLQEKEEKELEKAEKNKLQEEKDKELAKEKEKKLQEKRNKDIAKEKERILQEERNKGIAIDKLEEEEKQQTAGENSLKEKYLQMADELDYGIANKANELYANNPPSGFYGQYMGDWDDLLNEVWSVLKDTMPTDEFEKLKSEQIEWIKLKEQRFAEMPDGHAVERAAGTDFLANLNADRTYYLITNYMN